jgi:hypothetical protein
MFGKDRINNVIVDHAAYNLVDMLRSDPRLAGQIMAADRTIDTVDILDLAFVRKLFYFRHIACGGVHPSMGFLPVSKIGDDAAAFLEVLVLARNFEATDPRDKIFALWNLAKDKAGLMFQMTYTAEVHEVYSNFAKAWMQLHQSLDMLGAVELSGESVFYDHAPSWCPDWSVPSVSSSLVRRERIPTYFMPVVDSQEGALYNACGVSSRRPAMPLFKFDDSSLCCTGMVIDQIDRILDEPPSAPPRYLPSCDPVSYHKFQYWKPALTIALAVAKHRQYDSITQAVVAMFHGDAPAAWPPRVQNARNLSDQHPSEEYVCVPDMSRHIRYYGGSYNRTDAWDVVAAVLRGRIPFVSQQGYMGLIPAFVDQKSGPWLLAVVAACSVPLLLRERPDGSYELCGTCFVQGWMDGEIISDLAETDDHEEFWDAIRESAQLVIR